MGAGHFFPEFFFDCAAFLEERFDVRGSSQALVVIARLADRYLRFETFPPGGTAAARQWIHTALERHFAELAEGWREENLSELLERVQELSEAGWQDLHAELMNYRHGPQAYEWAGGKLRRKGFRLSLDGQHDLTAGFLESGVLARSLAGFEVQKGAGRETSWLATLFYRYALRELLRRRHFLPPGDLAAWPAAGPAPDEVFVRKETRRLLSEGLRGLPAAEYKLIALRFGLGARPHAFNELAPDFGPTVYKVRERLRAGLMMLGARLHGRREPESRERRGSI